MCPDDRFDFLTVAVALSILGAVLCFAAAVFVRGLGYGG